MSTHVPYLATICYVGLLPHPDQDFTSGVLLTGRQRSTKTVN